MKKLHVVRDQAEKAKLCKLSTCFDDRMVTTQMLDKGNLEMRKVP
jgi:hypothetical protein